jgi:hypothetical protein
VAARRKIRAPQDAKDFVPYLQKVNPDTEVLFIVFLGTTALGALRQTVELGLHKRLQRYTVICTTEGIGQEEVGKESAGAYYEYHPRHLDRCQKNCRLMKKPIARPVEWAMTERKWAIQK